MLFNSQVFLFYFLPITLIGYFALGRVSVPAAKIWLIAASFVFYGWWNPIYVPLIVFSMSVNYGFGWLLQRDRPQLTPRVRRRLLVVGLAFNLGLLGYFKYRGFFLDNLNALVGEDFRYGQIVLPLAISFFTFQKIAYLVDSYLGKVRLMPLIDYVLFVMFFPQLIAGPIVHYADVVPQFQKRETYRLNLDNLSDGVLIFMLGLAKKVVLADQFGSYADVGFGAASAGQTLSFLAAWIAALSYMLQIYFDFSGYSDMAIGLARMMNVKLPMNFNSPYQATSIVEFWRRWHMTLSRFLRDYVYIPLGGHRHGRGRRYLNLMLTMILGGLWHGAAWTFVIWGTLHGLYLSVNHLWGSVAVPGRGHWLYRMAAWIVTLAAVLFAWVIFRASSLDAAGRIYAGMLGLNGALMPDQILSLMPPLRAFFQGVGNVPFLGDSTVMGVVQAFVLVALGAYIALATPNIYHSSHRRRLVMLVLCFAFVVQRVLFSAGASPFLYFQF